ncbi:hypothetical protein F5879DRAFT_888432 [Lentinula edodes]|uniref:uncharacterized protein n=1 Tax=Lentinula edodes TaxID=5353 RepID=UPI001E8E267D|nr:uncharacterized protein C8R40DRAFT_1105241 [Lentinula edodes]KAH7875178.1 hypothetical protein C8R40DRAFT_1105241 [Lentinula edodes]KAJ3899276.1 hypothetical protein F5879DRAFT_888432 [Lentinula edodes]KAJ3913643.1 hypothetical protein F5877DRAFT_83603 [Lentinula edodes]
MSYASVAGSNLPSSQPRPDPALWTTDSPTASIVADDASKVNLVHPDFKEHPATVYSENRPPPDDTPSPRNKKNRRLREAEAEGLYLWQITKQYLFRPGVAGGLIGIINLGLLAGASRAFYTQPNLRSDRKVIASTTAAALAILGVEGFAAEKYAQTPKGQNEARRAKEEGTLIYKHLRENILRPGVLGGLLGLVNAAILGSVGYLSYIHWNKPTWDRRVVSAISVGLFTLWGSEGALAERYRATHH